MRPGETGNFLSSAKSEIVVPGNRARNGRVRVSSLEATISVFVKVLNLKKITWIKKKVVVPVVGKQGNRQ